MSAVSAHNIDNLLEFIHLYIADTLHAASFEDAEKLLKGKTKEEKVQFYININNAISNNLILPKITLMSLDPFIMGIALRPEIKTVSSSIQLQEITQTVSSSTQLQEIIQTIRTGSHAEFPGLGQIGQLMISQDRIVEKSKRQKKREKKWAYTG